LFLPRKRPPREMNSALRKNLIWGGFHLLKRKNRDSPRSE